MKTKFYFLLITATLIVSGCKSIEKLVDEGRYDEAIVVATKKLAGKKKKKTKHIRALEEAFAKVNQRDLAYISDLKSHGDPSAWEQVHDYLLDISERQNRVIPFLPIVSKDGYVGHFEMIDTRPLINEAAHEAATHRLETGKFKLTQAQSNGNKLLAQEAFYDFEVADRYQPEIRNVSDLKTEAYLLGVFHVLVKRDNRYERDFGSFIPFGLHKIDSRWVKYHDNTSDHDHFDLVTDLIVKRIELSPEREQINNFIETKEIEKWVDAIDQNGNLVVDSSGNRIQVKQIEVIQAEITEVIRTRKALFDGTAEIRDFNSGAILDRKFFTHEIDFNSDACTFRGDRRAISNTVIKRIDHVLLPFPSDVQLVSEGLENIHADYIRYLDRLRITDLIGFEYVWND